MKKNKSLNIFAARCSINASIGIGIKSGLEFKGPFIWRLIHSSCFASPLFKRLCCFSCDFVLFIFHLARKTFDWNRISLISSFFLCFQVNREPVRHQFEWIVASAAAAAAIFWIILRFVAIFHLHFLFNLLHAGQQKPYSQLNCSIKNEIHTHKQNELKKKYDDTHTQKKTLQSNRKETTRNKLKCRNKMQL